MRYLCELHGEVVNRAAGKANTARQAETILFTIWRRCKAVSDAEQDCSAS